MSALSIVANVLNGVERIAASWDKHFEHVVCLRRITEKTGLRSAYIVGLGMLSLMSAVFLGLGANFIINLIGFAYPAYASFKALETHTTEDDARWLRYWILFGILQLADTFINFLLTWIPFYIMIKMGLLIYMMWPTFDGANTIYKRVARPALLAYQGPIDASIAQIQAYLRNAAPAASADGGDDAPAAVPGDWARHEEVDRAMDAADGEEEDPKDK